MFEGALQFESAASDVLQIFAEQANYAFRGDWSARFLELLIVHQHLARENKSLGTLTRGGQSAVHKQFVESNLQKLFYPQVLPRECQHPLQCKVLKRL